MQPITRERQSIGSYRIVGKLGKGSFGQVLLAQKDSGSQNISQVKYNNLLSKLYETISNVKPMLQIEFDIANQIYSYHQSTIHLKQQNKKFKGQQDIKQINHFCQLNLPFPKIYQFGTQDTFSYLVMERLHETLQQKISELKLESSLSQAVVIQAIQLMHKLGYLHRDIKPGNFMIRKNGQHKQELVLMDFGLAKRYLKSNGEHIKLKEGKKLTGTPIYCSKSTHQGYQQSRKDDLECWIYTILHLIKPLPWEIPQIILQKDKQLQNEKIIALKKKISLKDILNSTDITERQYYPQCLKQICRYVQSLQFSAQPDYQYIQKVINDNAKKIGINIQRPIIQWNLKQQRSKKDSTQKDLKIKFSLKDKINRQLNKICIQKFDKNNLFGQIVNRNNINSQLN